MSEQSFQDRSHAFQPDIFTASAEYATRFSGGVGKFFLETQVNSVKKLLPTTTGQQLKILEVGGGHLQMTEALLELGHQVVIHASSAEALTRLSHSELKNSVQALVAPAAALPVDDEEFDITIALRLLPHTENTQKLLQEMARVSRLGVIFDFASSGGLNSLSPLLYPLKRKIEKNTRPYFLNSEAELRRSLESLGLKRITTEPQFVLPMGIHRKLGSPKFSKLSEGLLKKLGVTKLFGNPIIIGAFK